MVNGSISDLDNSSIERQYFIAVPPGSEAESVYKLFTLSEDSEAEWLSASCDLLSSQLSDTYKRMDRLGFKLPDIY